MVSQNVELPEPDNELVPTRAALVHNPLASLGIDDRFRPVWLTTRRHACTPRRWTLARFSKRLKNSNARTIVPQAARGNIDNSIG